MMSEVEHVSKHKHMLTVYDLPIPSFSNNQGWYREDSTPLEVKILKRDSSYDLMPPPATNKVSSKERTTVQRKRAWLFENIKSNNIENNRLFSESNILSINQKRKEGKTKGGMTIYNKLVDIYIRNLVSRTTKNENFIRCNYLDELVRCEKLGYLILKLYPRGFALYIKIQNMAPVEVRRRDYSEYDIASDEIFEAIDNEEIPYEIFDLLYEFQDSKRNGFLLYDYHMIVHIQKFSSDIDVHNTHTTKPIFSSFVLLKPTMNTCIALTNSYTSDNIVNVEEDKVAIRQYEASLFSKISGDLYISTDEFALELTDILRSYANPFASKSSKLMNLNAEKWKPPLWQSCLEAYRNDYKKFSERCIQFDSCPESVEEFNESHGSPTFLFEDAQKVFHSILASIEIKSVEDPSHPLVDIFHFYVEKNTKDNNKMNNYPNPKKYKLAVYRKDGQFYVFAGHKLLPEKLLPCLQYCVGNRERLNKFFLTYMEIISDGFTQIMRVQHKGKTVYHFEGRRFACMGESENVIVLTDSNFKETVLNSKDPWLVQFYEPHMEHYQSLTTEWAEAAKALRRKVQLGSINTAVHKIMAKKYNIKEVPSIKYFSAGDKDGTAVEYDGGKIVKDIVDWTLGKITKPMAASKGLSENVIELTDSNFKEKVLDSSDIWVVQFYASGCENYKQLVSELAEAAAKLKGRVKFGSLDVKAHTLIPNNFEIRDDNVPIIKLFPQWKKNSTAKEYIDEMTAEDIFNWTFNIIELELNEEMQEDDILLSTSAYSLHKSHKKDNKGNTFSGSQCRESGEMFLSKEIKTIENDSVITMFEAHSFEFQKDKKSVAESFFEAHMKKKAIEIYPSLKSEFMPQSIAAKEFMLHLDDCDKVLTPKVSSVYRRIFSNTCKSPNIYKAKSAFKKTSE